MPDFYLFKYMIYMELNIYKNRIGCRQPYGGFLQPPLTAKFEIFLGIAEIFIQLLCY